MAEVKFTKGSEEWMMFTDFWQICQKYWIVEDTKEYWNNLFDELKIFTKKYNNDFAKRLALSFVNYQETNVKGKGEKK